MEEVSYEELYESQVKIIADLLAKRKKLERGGKIHEGWMDANFALQKALRVATSLFPGCDMDLMDDGYRYMLGVYHGAR